MLCKLSRLVMICLAMLVTSLETHQDVKKRTLLNNEEHLQRNKRFDVRYITRYMVDHNGQTIHLREKAEFISLTRHGHFFPARWRAVVTLRAPHGHVLRIRFLKMRRRLAPHFPGLCNQRLFLYDGDSIFSRLIHDVMKPLCSNMDTDLVSSGRPMTFLFVSDGGPFFDRHGFTATVTPTKNGDCATKDFRCGNGYCVNNVLSCDGYNNCGDMSDENKCSFTDLTAVSISHAWTVLTDLEIATIILGCVGILVIIIMLIWYIATSCKARAASDYQNIETPDAPPPSYNEKWNPTVNQ